MSSIFNIADSSDDKEGSLILYVNNDGTINVDQQTLNKILAKQYDSGNVSVVRVDSDSTEGNENVNLMIEKFGAEQLASAAAATQLAVSQLNTATPQLTAPQPDTTSTPCVPAEVTTQPGGTSGDAAGDIVIDPFSQMDPEQLERLENALQSEQAKQILGTNLEDNLLEMLEGGSGVEDSSVHNDHSYTTPLSSPIKQTTGAAKQAVLSPTPTVQLTTRGGRAKGKVVIGTPAVVSTAASPVVTSTTKTGNIVLTRPQQILVSRGGRNQASGGQTFVIKRQTKIITPPPVNPTTPPNTAATVAPNGVVGSRTPKILQRRVVKSKLIAPKPVVPAQPATDAADTLAAQSLVQMASELQNIAGTSKKEAAPKKGGGRKSKTSAAAAVATLEQVDDEMAAVLEAMHAEDSPTKKSPPKPAKHPATRLKSPDPQHGKAEQQDDVKKRRHSSGRHSTEQSEVLGPELFSTPDIIRRVSTQKTEQHKDDEEEAESLLNSLTDVTKEESLLLDELTNQVLITPSDELKDVSDIIESVDTQVEETVTTATTQPVNKPVKVVKLKAPSPQAKAKKKPGATKADSHRLTIRELKSPHLNKNITVFIKEKSDQSGTPGASSPVVTPLATPVTPQVTPTSLVQATPPNASTPSTGERKRQSTRKRIPTEKAAALIMEKDESGLSGVLASSFLEPQPVPEPVPELPTPVTVPVVVIPPDPVLPEPVVEEESVVMEEVESELESWNSEDDPDRLWCICRKPHNNRFMICCDTCEDWFHGKCVGITKATGQQMEAQGIEWSCPKCRQAKETKKTPAKPKQTPPKPVPAKQMPGRSPTKQPAKPPVAVKQPVPPQPVKAVVIKTQQTTIGAISCCTCQKPARIASCYCSDVCIKKHVLERLMAIKRETHRLQTNSRVVVLERKTGKLLTGDAAPLADGLLNWILSNPTYEVVDPSSLPNYAKLDQPKPPIQRTGSLKQMVLSTKSLAPGIKQLTFAPKAPVNIKQPAQSPSPTTTTPPAIPKILKLEGVAKANIVSSTKQVAGQQVKQQVAGQHVKQQVVGQHAKQQVAGQHVKQQVAGQHAKQQVAGQHVKQQSLVQTPTKTPVKLDNLITKSTVKKEDLKPSGVKRKISGPKSPPHTPTSTQKPPVAPVSPEKKRRESEVKPPVAPASVEKKRRESESKPPVERKRRESESVSSTTPTTPSAEKNPSVRDNVKKSLHELLVQRSKDDDILKTISSDQVKEISDAIEEELYQVFNNTGAKYKSKYRSLVFNIKDPKNLTLYKRILDKSLSGSELVRLSPEELASQELAEWREQEAKHQLDIIKKNELDLIHQAKTVVLKSRKGEEVIESKTLEKSITELESALNRTADDVDEDYLSKSTRDSTDTKISDEELKLLEKLKDKDDKSRSKKKKHSSSHSRSSSRSTKSSHHSRSRRSTRSSKSKHRSKSRSKSPHKRSRSKSKHRSKSRSPHKHRSKSRSPHKHRSKSRSKSPHRHRSRSKHRSDSHSRHSSRSHRHKKEEDILQSVEPELEDIILSEEQEIILPQLDEIEEEQPFRPISPKEDDKEDSDIEPTSTVTIATPPYPPEEDTSVWCGTLNMVDVTKLQTKAHQVSGCCDNLDIELSDNLECVGRIQPDSVWDYISRMKKSGTKEIVVVRFTSETEEEKMNYLALYSYLSSRNRMAVIGNISKTVKDFYVLPLASHSPIPQVLLPLDGPGFDDYRPHLLLGIIIRTRRGKSGKEIVSSHSVSGVGSPERSYTPPLPSTTDDHITSPLLAMDDEEPYEPGDDSPYTPEDDSLPAATSTVPQVPATPYIPDIERNIEEVNRMIEQKKQQIESLAMQANLNISDEVGEYEDRNEVGGDVIPFLDSKTLPAISIPSNLHDILASINQPGRITPGDNTTSTSDSLDSRSYQDASLQDDSLSSTSQGSRARDPRKQQVVSSTPSQLSQMSDVDLMRKAAQLGFVSEPMPPAPLVFYPAPPVGAPPPPPYIQPPLPPPAYRPPDPPLPPPPVYTKPPEPPVYTPPPEPPVYTKPPEPPVYRNQPAAPVNLPPEPPVYTKPPEPPVYRSPPPYHPPSPPPPTYTKSTSKRKDWEPDVDMRFEKRSRGQDRFRDTDMRRDSVRGHRGRGFYNRGFNRGGGGYYRRQPYDGIQSEWDEEIRNFEQRKSKEAAERRKRRSSPSSPPPTRKSRSSRSTSRP